jgi:hypothetical protein
MEEGKETTKGFDEQATRADIRSVGELIHETIGRPGLLFLGIFGSI